MPDGKPRPLKYRELRKKLKEFCVIEDPHCRGKGSERVLIKPRSPGEMKGPQYTVKHHGEGCEISKPVIVALLRRFGIRPGDFWG